MTTIDWKQVKNLASGSYNSKEAIEMSAMIGARTLQYAAGEMGYWNKKRPDVTFNLFGGLAQIPLYTVQYLEVAHSQDLLQYRAIGGEFLAQQQGGNWGVRIDTLLTGPTAAFMLSLLQYIKDYSKGKSESLDPDKDWDNIKQSTTNETDKIKERVSAANLYPASANMGAAGSVRAFTDVRAQVSSGMLDLSNLPGWTGGTYTGFQGVKNDIDFNGAKYKEYTGFRDVDFDYSGDVVTDDFVDEANLQMEVARDKELELTLPDDYSWSESEWHKTFTVFTRDEILFDMYIETLAYRLTTKNGGKAIEVNILLRHFVPPPIISSELVQVRKPSENNSIVNGDPVLGAADDFYLARTVRKIPRIRDSSKSRDPMQTIKTVEVGLQIAHKLAERTYRFGVLFGNRVSIDDLKYGKVNSFGKALSAVTNNFKRKTIVYN